MLDKVVIVGVGLMGGSFALALKDNSLAKEIVGVDNSTTNLEKAMQRGIIDSHAPLAQAVQDASLVVIAIPVNHIPLESIKVLNLISDKQIIIDLGSTKEELCSVISQHPKRSRYVATHPMWGTEYSGPESAVHGAFKGRVLVICEKEKTDNDALEIIEKIYTVFGMPIRYMCPEEHDMHAAYVSHISHITSYALALTVLEKEKEDDNIFALAGGGFESTVRLAKSSYSMWVPIFMQNKYNVLDVLREHIHQLNILRKMIERDDREGLNQVITKANTINKIID